MYTYVIINIPRCPHTLDRVGVSDRVALATPSGGATRPRRSTASFSAWLWPVINPQPSEKGV